MQAETHRCLAPDGRTVSDSECGEPAGMPVMYCHGFPGSRLEAKLADAAAGALGIRLIAADRPGFGASDLQPDRRIADWPGDLAALAGSLSTARFHVIGFSGGGNGEDPMTIDLSNPGVRSRRHRTLPMPAGPWSHLAGMLLCLAMALPAFADSGTGSAPANAPAFSPCPAIRIDPKDFGQNERSLICDAADETRAFFRAHGIDIKRSIHVRASDRQADPVLPHIGAYTLASKTVRLIGLAQAGHQVPENTLFGLPLNATLYQSVVVHELAHAVANQHFADSRPSLVAQEYIAYAAQLSTMEPATRQRILTSNKLPPYKSIDEMSSIYYAMNPNGFGIKAYLHFVSLDDPGRFLRRLLAGDIQPADSEDVLP
jgi:hypothetical protein